jgi:Skp family chaperone for outer membrane proteins
MSAERLRDRLRASHEALLQIQSNVLTPDQIKTLARETTAENSEELRKVPIEEQTKSTWEHRPPTEKERQQATQKVQKKMQKQIEELQEIPGPEILGEEGEHLYRRVVRDEQRRSGAAPDNW